MGENRNINITASGQDVTISMSGCIDSNNSAQAE